MRFTGMHKVTVLVTLCALFSWSCIQPTDAAVDKAAPAPVDDPATIAPEEPVVPEAPEVPAWQPEPQTVYILDGVDAIYLQSSTDDADHFRSLCSAWSGAVESYNAKRNKPGPYPYRFVAGTPPGGI